MEENSNFTSKPYVTHMGSRVISSMPQTAEIDVAPSVQPSVIDKFVRKVAWAICSTYHTVLKASPGTAIFGPDMSFDIPFLAD
eukprot:CCRYP_011701-RA/>CCRYP_011701-RA protein AED:0.39 eAED:0.39 QI:0/0/0/1/0/0/2/0/82